MLLRPPQFDVDLRLPASERWDELLTNKWVTKNAQSLAGTIWSQGPFALRTLLAKVATGLATFTLSNNDYVEDMEEWATYAIGSLDETVFANFAYEIYHLGTSAGLCTSVGFHTTGLGMVHARNLDWSLPRMRTATMLLNCKSAAGPFKAVTVPGMVGVLSGVAAGRFSITVNSKEDGSGIPNAGGWSAALLTRWILENCVSFDQALRTAKKAPAFAPFFLTLVGTQPGQAAVVEVGRDGHNRVVRSKQNAPVAVANHFPTDSYQDPSRSEDRQRMAERRARASTAKTLRGCFWVLNEFPVMKSDTVQSMVMHPGSGDVLLQKL
ncbi:MAG: hypothetical protein JSR82_19395 [Verrucomicrobia bacterium]|nr:hypothetical protein [Verrucomicrobiota bacterium]